MYVDIYNWNFPGGLPKLILRIFVDPQNYVTAEKSRSIKYCKSLLSSAK